MTNFSHLYLLFATLFLVPLVLATDHVVGDRSGWAIGVDYFSWTTGKTFFVGDNLVFKYKKGLHNVFDVNVTAFSECATPTNQPPLDTGNDVVRLTRPGTKWFICNIAHHCQSGQKLIISVQNQPPPPPVGHLSSPPPTSIPSPTPTVVGQPAPQPSSLPPLPPAASSPSLPPSAPNQTKNPQLPAPTPSESNPPSHSPAPSATAPPPSGAAAKSAVSGLLGFIVVAVGVLASIM